ncbi:MAG: type II toxin-antitoxin system VapB family antitoxin [Deltaproteobacteria bacterium]|nr:type II toxin-antitoxin system VapB family antitoxin [Deltaproteobacteria bacterium]
MPLSIKDPEANRLARTVAQLTGETITNAVITALRERLEKIERKANDAIFLVDDIMAIGRHFASLPADDKRNHAEMLYDKNGLPK